MTGRSFVARTAAVALGVCACTGEIGVPGGKGGPSGGDPTPDEQGNLPYKPATPAPAAIPARVWRLTHADYQRSVRDFLGVDPDIAVLQPELDDGIFADLSNTGFVRVDLARNYYDLAEATAMAATEAQLRALATSCTTLTASCKATFISSALARGFRRPATAEEIADAGGTFDIAAASGDVLLPFRSVVQGILTSPYFLYRTEMGAPADAANANFSLTNHEVATLLSYSLLGEPPSATLRAAADRGELTRPASLRANVESLLSSSAAGARLQDFLGQWVTVNQFGDVFKFEERFPGFTAVQAAMRDETFAFLAQVGSMDGTFAGLLTTPVPAATGPLGSFYASALGGATSAAPATRTGFLGLGAVMAVHAHPDLSSPTLRGKFVRERLLCQHVTVPPVVPDLTEAEMRTPPKSTRELYGLHKTKTECAGCHEVLDGVGFTFESFDGAGRFRTEELFRNQTVAVPIDSSGTLVNTDVNRPLSGHTDLATALASSDWARECMALHGFRYYFGYASDVPRGLPPVTAGYGALAQGGRMRDLVAAIMSSPTTFERVRQ